MGTKKRKSYTPEYRREAARLVIDTGRTMTAVAREIGVGEQRGGSARHLHLDRRLVQRRRRHSKIGNLSPLQVRQDRRRPTHLRAVLVDAERDLELAIVGLDEHVDPIDLMPASKYP